MNRPTATGMVPSGSGVRAVDPDRCVTPRERGYLAVPSQPETRHATRPMLKGLDDDDRSFRYDSPATCFRRARSRGGADRHGPRVDRRVAGAAPPHAAVATLELDGHGYGHGIGLSQWGALRLRGRTTAGQRARSSITTTAARSPARPMSPTMTVRLLALDDQQTAVVHDRGALVVDGVGGPWRSVVAREMAPNSYTVWALGGADAGVSHRSRSRLTGWTRRRRRAAVGHDPPADRHVGAAPTSPISPRCASRRAGCAATAARSARSTAPPARTAPSTRCRSSSTCARSSPTRCRHRGPARRLGPRCRRRPSPRAASDWPRTATRTRRRAIWCASTTRASPGGQGVAGTYIRYEQPRRRRQRAGDRRHRPPCRLGGRPDRVHDVLGVVRRVDGGQHAAASPPSRTSATPRRATPTTLAGDRDGRGDQREVAHHRHLHRHHDHRALGPGRLGRSRHRDDGQRRRRLGVDHRRRVPQRDGAEVQLVRSCAARPSTTTTPPPTGPTAARDAPDERRRRRPRSPATHRRPGSSRSCPCGWSTPARASAPTRGS